MLTNTSSICACISCKQMCKTSPCFGTPQDILNLCVAGYRDKLRVSAWIDIEWHGLWPVIAPIATPTGCIFLNTADLCDLHNLDLKPSEGRLAHHSNKETAKLRRAVCFTWVNATGYMVLKMFGASSLELNRISELRNAYKR